MRFSNRQLALRTAAMILAISVSDYPSDDRQTLVVRIHELARRVISANLRVSFDGDSYYLTRPVPEWTEPSLPVQGVLGESNARGGLQVIGLAENLSALFELVEHIANRG